MSTFETILGLCISPPRSRGSEFGHVVLLVSCIMTMTSSCKSTTCTWIRRMVDWITILEKHFLVMYYDGLGITP